MALKEYVMQDGKRLRCGFTTGSAAAMAAKAACYMLFTGKKLSFVSIVTPAGVTVSAPVEAACIGKGCVSCGVRKDGGDDVDATDGLLICAKVSYRLESGILLTGGKGVGIVTKPGLNQPVGAYAINEVPRRMILFEVQSCCEEFEIAHGLTVEISVPDGEEVAKKTFNPRLGIEGGISILGTDGIVRPKSVQALVDTIKVEIAQRAALGDRYLLTVPGSYGADFAAGSAGLERIDPVQCSNYVGQTIDIARDAGMKGLLLVSHAGKLCKLAGGIMNTHSKEADCRAELFAAFAAAEGADKATVLALLESVSADACIAILNERGLTKAVLARMMARIDYYLTHRADGMMIGAIMFSAKYGFLGQTPGAARLIAALQEQRMAKDREERS